MIESSLIVDFQQFRPNHAQALILCDLEARMRRSLAMQRTAYGVNLGDIDPAFINAYLSYFLKHKDQKTGDAKGDVRSITDS